MVRGGAGLALSLPPLRCIDETGHVSVLPEASSQPTGLASSLGSSLSRWSSSASLKAFKTLDSVLLGGETDRGQDRATS